ncbi:yippee zinc-binding/DNA-binding /Mis18, centromere assembly-domain-containing protein [Aspergillus alliaceus]|nr:yippee zinc-binding/DNA-binding /Mis18, centromere assembly-domain-containing protein [Aspergillus alliaceus]KAB8230554.1 yippee zinc-binding/DNA-binding /Mis18, centromere assembly-domain-containing protein [Aspergillus alliaceus]
MESGFSGTIVPEHKGEATHTIPGECERLFCDTLSVIFLGEGRFSRQELLGVDAYQAQPSSLSYEHSQLQDWVEVLDYTSDCIYRGFVTELNEERALFIFFGERALGQGLKTGLIALFELAGLSEFGCSQIIIISKGFTGRHGRAYLVSAEPIACAVSLGTTSSPTDSLPNTIIQNPVSRQLVTGAHTVSDISCAFCGSVLGWKYVAAEEESQRYKVGKFILETKRTMTSSSWESASYADPIALPGLRPLDLEVSGDRVEFDSQDEDECEDLFAGVWSPGLAIRRRSRKLDRHPSIFGITP